MAETSSCVQGKSLKRVWECEDSFAVWSRAVNPCAEAEGVSSQLGWAVDPHSHPHLSMCVCAQICTETLEALLVLRLLQTLRSTECFRNRAL